jgi:hypothetical protein
MLRATPGQLRRLCHGAFCLVGCLVALLANAAEAPDAGANALKNNPNTITNANTNTNPTINTNLNTTCNIACSTHCNNSGPMVAIIIDDMGHHLQRGREALALPGRLTFAVIPFSAHSRPLARAAQAGGKEVMLHAPMSTLNNTPLGRNGLTAELSREEFLRNLRLALDDVPQAEGVNNHMGSDLTQRRQQMAWLMQELRWRDLYFVDSRTSDRTVAATVAGEFNVPNLSRQVFLDNDTNADAIAERFDVLVNRAKREGLGIAIGHPYRATINYLKRALPELQAQGIRTVYVSEAIEFLEDGANASDCAVADSMQPRAEANDEVEDGPTENTDQPASGTSANRTAPPAADQHAAQAR